VNPALAIHRTVIRNSTFFAFSLIIEGTTEKVFLFIKPIYNKNLGFIEQKIVSLKNTEVPKI